MVEKRAEKKREARAEAKIKTDSPWLCIDGAWERWLEREARWISEAEWNKMKRGEEIRRTEKRLERLKRKGREAGRAE